MLETRSGVDEVRVAHTLDSCPSSTDKFEFKVVLKRQPKSVDDGF